MAYVQKRFTITRRHDGLIDTLAGELKVSRSAIIRIAMDQYLIHGRPVVGDEIAADALVAKAGGPEQQGCV